MAILKMILKPLKQQKIGVQTFVCSLVCALLRGMPTHHPDYDKFLETLPGVIGGQSNSEEWVRERIDETIIIGKEKLKKRGLELEKQVKYVGGPVLTIQDRLRLTALSMTDEIEDHIDQAISDVTKFDMKKFNPLSILRKQQAKSIMQKLLKNIMQTT